MPSRQSSARFCVWELSRRTKNTEAWKLPTQSSAAERYKPSAYLRSPFFAGAKDGRKGAVLVTSKLWVVKYHGSAHAVCSCWNILCTTNRCSLVECSLLHACFWSSLSASGRAYIWKCQHSASLCTVRDACSWCHGCCLSFSVCMKPAETFFFFFFSNWGIKTVAPVGRRNR